MNKHMRSVFVFVLALITIYTAATPATAQTTSSLKKVPWQGKEWFMHGVNMPWIQWGCDFGSGCNWGRNNIRYPEAQAKIRPEFQKLKDSKIHVVRWWLFPGNPSTNDQANRMIVTDSSGKPTGIDPGVYQDIDAALALAEEYDIYYNFTLFSAPSSLPASWRDNETHRQALADVLGTMFARYKDNPRLMAWETFNEPEWEIFWDNQADMRTKTVDLVKRIIAKQRATTPALVNIGPAWVQLDVWANAKVDVDFYSPHYYDNMDNQWGRRDNAFTVTADQLRSEYGITEPILLGEMFVGASCPSTDLCTDPMPALERYEEARKRGYAGVWGWSLFYNSTGDKYQVDLAAAKTFAGRYSDIGPSSTGGSVPSAIPTRSPTSTVPTATRTPSPSPTRLPSGEVTLTPSRTPTPNPSVSPITQNFSSSATAQSIKPGTQATIIANVTSKNASNVLVDVEVYNPAGTKVHQAFFSNQAFTAGQTRQFTVNWATGANLVPGTYSLRMGVFSNDWGTLHHWNASAGTLVVTSAAPSPTLTPTRAPTATPSRVPTSAPTTAQSSVWIYARGSNGGGIYPTLQVSVNGTVVKTFYNVVDNYTNPLKFQFTRKITAADVVKVHFINDYYKSNTDDRNTRIDKIVVDGVTYQSEAATTYGVGVASATGCSQGYLQQELLKCNGYLQYKIQ